MPSILASGTSEDRDCALNEAVMFYFSARVHEMRFYVQVF